MNKKGFTLIELLGTIIILVAIALIAFPAVLNMLNESQGETDDAMKDIAIGATREYVTDRVDDFPKALESSSSIKSSDSYKYNGANYEFVTNIDGYWIYLADVDGKGTWRAMPQGSDKSEFSRLSFPISYDQARGFEPINEPSAITKLRKDLGKKLLSKSGQSVEATEDLTDLPENFQHAYTLANNDFDDDRYISHD